MAIDEKYLRTLEDYFDNCYHGPKTEMLGLQLLATSVPLLVAEIRRLRGIPEPAEPLLFPAACRGDPDRLP